MPLIENELENDRVDSDITSRLLGARGNQIAKARVFARETGVFATHLIGVAVEECLRNTLIVQSIVADGDRFEPNATLLSIEGPAATLLSIERTFLNFVSHACGVATHTRMFVDAIKPFPVKILATRKTIPLLRQLELIAVEAGGGYTHRRNLSDGILIKDNHLHFSSEEELLAAARRYHSPLHRVEIEVQDFESLKRVLKHLPDVIMLDNWEFSDLVRAIKLIDKRCEVEVSGGISVENIRAIAELSVPYISVGKVTHAARGIDLSMEFL